MVRKRHKNGYTINVIKLFKETTTSNFKREKDDKGNLTGRTPFTEIMFFIEEDLKNAFLSIEAIARKHKRKSITTDDVVEYYSIVGRPKLHEYELVEAVEDEK